MRFDLSAYYANERMAYNLLKYGQKDPNTGAVTIAPTPAKSIHAPAHVRQEVPFINTQQDFLFQFASNFAGGGTTAALGNLQFGRNDIICVFAIQILLGLGAAANNRRYFSQGIAADDDSLYNGFLFFETESDKPINLMLTRDFREEGPMFGYSGVQLIAPDRIWMGQLSSLQMTIRMQNNIAGLALTPNLFISVSLHCALAQA